MKRIFLAIFAVAALAAVPASATTFDFNAGVPVEISLGGDMTWNVTGGGHLYMEQYYSDDYIFFAVPVKVDNFQMVGWPWQSYNYPTSGTGWLVDIEAFDIANNKLWNATIDLSGYLGWDPWLTVNVGVDNVSKMAFYSPHVTHNAGFWPSIDNLVVNASTPEIPEPSTLLLLGSGIAGLAVWRRKK